MKNLKFLSLLVFSFVFLASCGKKESEENKPEESTPAITTEPRIDLIRKVLRYNASGGIDDSVLFQYDMQNRVSKIEFGNLISSQFTNLTKYVYSKDQAGNNVINETHSVLNSSGQYQINAYVVYRMILNYPNTHIKATFGNNSTQYQVSGDSLGLVKYISQSMVKKQVDYYLDYTYKSRNGNIIEATPDSYPGAGGSCTYEYYSQPYNHDLFVTGFGCKQTLFWPEGLEDVFDNRHRFLGKRNQNLVKKAYFGTTVELFEYEFNSLGLVSKIKMATVSTSAGTTPLQTKYEIFYY